MARSKGISDNRVFFFFFSNNHTVFTVWALTEEGLALTEQLQVTGGEQYNRVHAADKVSSAITRRAYYLPATLSTYTHNFIRFSVIVTNN